MSDSPLVIGPFIELTFKYADLQLLQNVDAEVVNFTLDPLAGSVPACIFCKYSDLRIRADEQVPPGNRIFCMKSGVRLAARGEIVGSEPYHDFCLVAGRDKGVV